ncbi:hypothetical protein F4804DRAFT_354332 [Jackrogersella minutella]|nr:hypothetical protein F4804DRAFT_354332 [Jackrogersella minutella]
MTVNRIPKNYSEKITIMIRDRDFDVIARTVMILAYLAVEDDSLVAAENAIHLWYSAFLPESLDNWIHEEFSSYAKRMNGLVHASGEERRKSKGVVNWKDKIKLVMTESDFCRLEHYFTRELPNAEAHRARKAVVACPTRLDSRECRLFKQPPPERLPQTKFLEDRILLPFGWSRDDFTKPNITLFDFVEGEGIRWLLDDTMTPERGWSRFEFKKACSSRTTNDVLGKLFYYLRDNIIATFHKQIRTLKIVFEIELVETSSLIGSLPKNEYAGTFDRIIVSGLDEPANIMEDNFIEVLGRHLRPTNPFATLITPHRLALRKDALFKGDRHTYDYDERLKWYLPEPCGDRPYDARMFSARAVVRRQLDHLGSTEHYETLFSRYLPPENFGGNQIRSVRRRLNSIIVNQWPHREIPCKYRSRRIVEVFPDYLAEERYPAFEYIEWERVNR